MLAALDLGLGTTGIAWIDDENNIYTDHISSSLTGPARLDEIVSGVLKIISGSALVGVEGYSFGSIGKRGKSSSSRPFQIGELGGAIRLELWRAGLTYIEIPPTVMKKYVSGSGITKKERIPFFIRKRLGCDLDVSMDEYDAIGLLLFTQHYVVNGDSTGKVNIISGAIANSCKQG